MVEKDCKMKTNQSALSDWHSLAAVARKTGKEVTISAERIIELDYIIANAERIARPITSLADYMEQNLGFEQARFTRLSKMLRGFGLNLGDFVRLRDAFK